MILSTSALRPREPGGQVYEDVALLVRVVKLVIVAVGSQHVRCLPDALVSPKSLRCTAETVLRKSKHAHRIMRAFQAVIRLPAPSGYLAG